MLPQKSCGYLQIHKAFSIGTSVTLPYWWQALCLAGHENKVFNACKSITKSEAYKRNVFLYVLFCAGHITFSFVNSPCLCEYVLHISFSQKNLTLYTFTVISLYSTIVFSFPMMICSFSFQVNLISVACKCLKSIAHYLFCSNKLTLGNIACVCQWS